MPDFPVNTKKKQGKRSGY